MADAPIYRRLRRCLEARGRAVLATVIAAADRALVGRKLLFVENPDGSAEHVGTVPPPWEVALRLRAAALAAGADTGKRVRVESFAEPGEARVAFERFEPPLRVVVAGGGHIGVPVCEFAALVGYPVTVIDDRPAFADPARFPRAERVVCADFRTGVPALGVDGATALVVVTRGHLHDLEVLRSVCHLRPFYVGMIGSRRRVLTVLRALRDEGVDEAFLERLYAPIGLDIGAETPEEIALAIVAEIVSLQRGGRAVHCRDALGVLSREALAPRGNAGGARSGDREAGAGASCMKADTGADL